VDSRPDLLRLTRDAGAAPPERLAYVVAFDRTAERPDAIALAGLSAAGVHTAAMLGTAAVLAVLVYEVAGPGVLRRAWFNLDRIWAGVLVAAGLATIAGAVVHS
jgi:hypothetical protein